MTTRISPTVFAAVFGLLFAAIPAVAASKEQDGIETLRAANLHAAANLRARLYSTEQRIAEGQRIRAITPALANALRRQVAQTWAGMTRLSHQQGFVSAAELASYNRTLGNIDVKLSQHGVKKRIGGDKLVTVGMRPDRSTNDFRYDCQNLPVPIAIPGDRLDRSLAQLRLATRCPISGTQLGRSKRSRPVVGTMTPTNALQAMLSGTGLQMRTLKGGFEVLPLPRG